MKKKLRGSIKWFLKLSLFKKGIFLVIVLAILYFAGSKILSQQNSQPQYQTAQAERGTLITSVTASGVVTAGSSASITTSATGVVKEVFVQNGDAVIKDQEIAEITLDSDSQQRQAQAWSSYLSAQNTLNSAKAKMNSLQAALFTANQKFVNGAGTQDPIIDDPTYIIQRADWLQAEADYNNQANVIRQAEAALSSVWLTQQQISSIIAAPIAGVVTDLTLTPGLSISGGSDQSSATTGTNNTTVNSSQTLGAISLEDGRPLATVNLTEIDITKVNMGQKATLTLDAFPEKTFTGRITGINTNGTTSSGVTNYPVTIMFDSTVSNMYPNMAVNASIITSVKDNALLVPSSAVQTANGESTARVKKGEKIEMVPVEVGESGDTQIEIASGISEGDTVVTGQTGGSVSANDGQQSTSLFGGSGFGGGRGFGGGGAGGGVRIQGGGAQNR